jgi:hypothetical protein
MKKAKKFIRRLKMAIKYIFDESLSMDKLDTDPYNDLDSSC